ncbi:fungal-specific transcription factor domain-containing protein [Flagelloscypha sp. PMI_526]|nr:fungal-specific transcription factor domain-containing protein [Flagelloscypha sp. PMI_526]
MDHKYSPDTVSPSSRSTPSPSNTHHTSDEKLNHTARVPLACLRCRAKRARCSGDRPVCQSCQKAGDDCQWPTGRRRKRTRREMEADERREREQTEAQANHTSKANMHASPSPHSAFGPSPATPWGSGPIQNDATALWPFQHIPANPSNFIWPPQNFTQPPPNPYDITSHSLSGLGLPSLHSQAPRNEAAQLVQALKSDVAFIEGDPSRQEGLELYYYRFSGSTAITPGINRISLKLQPRPANPNQLENAAPLPTTLSQIASPELPLAMFDSSGMPVDSVSLPLLERFFETMCQHFPSVQRDRMEQRFSTNTMSAFMLNCICAVTARFMPDLKDSPAKVCAPFITKAQELIIPLLQLPTTDVVTGLLLLAWANYGQNSDSGLWQYSGICFRMSQDLGLHEVSDIYEDTRHLVRTRLLLWSLFITDRILSFQTGRPFSISEDVIEIPLPSDEDMYPDPAGRKPPSGSHARVEPCAFPALARLMVLCGRIANVLNGRRGRTRTLVGPTPADPQMLSGLQRQLVQFYSELPVSLRWSVDTFKQQEARGHGSVFLTLHLWANAVMALVYHPELITGTSGSQTPLTSTMDRSIKLSLASSRIISAPSVHGGSPTTMVDGETPTKDQHASAFLTSLTIQNLDVLRGALRRMEHYWAGVGYVSGVLRERAAAVGLGHVYNLEEPPDRTKKTFISLPDKGLLRRFAPNMPKSVRPPTETSLKESLAASSSAMATTEEWPAAYLNTFALDDLMSSYSIEGLFVSPADHYDLENLLNMGNNFAGQS